MALILALTILSSCGKQCRESKMARRDFHPVPHAYFSAFRPGNWWVLNTSTGMRDSVWINDYKEEDILSFEACFKYPERRFQIMAELIPLMSDAIYSSTFEMTFFSMNGDFSVAYDGGGMIANPRVSLMDTLITGATVHANVLRIDALEPNTPLRTLHFAQGRGLVRIVTESDTFNLLNSHVQ